MARLTEEMAAEVGMYIASRLQKVDAESIKALLPEGYTVEVEEIEEGLYQATIRTADGEGVLVVLFNFNPSWVSPVTYMGHGVLSLEGVRRLYEKLFAHSGSTG